MIEKTNLLGAFIAVSFYVMAILVFVSRLAGKPQYGYWIGLFQFLLVPTLVYLLWHGPQLGRPAIYYLQCGLMLAWLALELYLDYIGQVDFRHTRWVVIAYVTLLFAGSGGMIGVASLAGRPWTVAAIILFLAMAVLAFVQRAITGM